MLNAVYAYICIGKDADAIEDLDLMLMFEDFEVRQHDLKSKRAMRDARMRLGMVGPPPKKGPR